MPENYVVKSGAIIFFHPNKKKYSEVSDKRVGLNKRLGWKIHPICSTRE